MEDKCSCAIRYEDIKYDGITDAQEEYEIYLQKFCYLHNMTREEAEELAMVKLCKEGILNGCK